MPNSSLIEIRAGAIIDDDTGEIKVNDETRDIVLDEVIIESEVLLTNESSHPFPVKISESVLFYYFQQRKQVSGFLGYEISLLIFFFSVPGYTQVGRQWEYMYCSLRVAYFLVDQFLGLSVSSDPFQVTRFGSLPFLLLLIVLDFSNVDPASKSLSIPIPSLTFGTISSLDSGSMSGVLLLSSFSVMSTSSSGPIILVPAMRLFNLFADIDEFLTDVEKLCSI